MTEQDSRYLICRHIKLNRIRCQSPALTGQTFCYFHARLHNHPRLAPARKIASAAVSALPEFTLPPLEDAESIRLAISNLCQAIAQCQIPLPRARFLLHALEVAASGLRQSHTALSPQAKKQP